MMTNDDDFNKTTVVQLILSTPNKQITKQKIIKKKQNPPVNPKESSKKNLP